MPGQTNLIVKNGAGVDKTFTAITPAAGDGGVALWQLREGTISAVFPALTAVSNASKIGRALKVKLKVPASFTDTVTGLTNVNGHCEMSATFMVPENYPEALKDDFVAFATALLSTPLLKSMVRDAYPAT